jgi:DNA-binding beta-propeller fold protein YncE
MNDTRLTQLLEDASRPEPPMGPVVSASMRAGDRLRWRRRITATAAIAALTALAVTVPAFALRAGPAPAAPALGGGTGAAFIETTRHTVVAVNLATGRARRPIRVPTISLTQSYGHPMATAPGGRTVWIMGNTELTPVNTRTDRAGTPIRLNARGVMDALITARGTRAYVALSPHGILVVNLTTRKVLTEIKAPNCSYMVPSPDGKLIYCDGEGIAIISTTTNTVLRTVPLTLSPYAVSVAPDSTTAYALAEGFSSISHGQNVGPFSQVTRINAAIGATGTIKIRNTEAAAMSPDGALVYAAGQRALYAVSPVSGKTVWHWQLPARSVSALAISPDGSTAFAYLVVDPNTDPGVILQVSPDGRTVYVELQKNLAVSYAVAVAASSGRIIASTPVRFPGPYPVAFAR